MKINSNISAIYTNESIRRNDRFMTKDMEQLSSGKRINRAGDDAAGTAVSSRMEKDIRGNRVATRNASDGISLVQTGEGAMTSIEAMLQRMRELAIQSKNGTYDTTDRTNLDEEFQQLLTEIDRVATITEFNGVKLLDGTGSGTVDLHIGSNATDIMTLTLQDTTITGLGFTTEDITDQANAGTALVTIDAALDTINTARATFGAYQNRLEYTVDNLNTNIVNTTSAKSRVVDADMAEASSSLAKHKVLTQSSIAMLAQANQTPQMVMQLLQG